MLISVAGQRRDWESLERKLASGFSLEEGAAVCGIPIEEALEWSEKRLETRPFDVLSLQLSAADALKTGLQALKGIAGDLQNEDRLAAASALVRFAMDAKKLVRATGKDKEDRTGGRMRLQLDLWDAPGNWRLEDAHEKAK